MSLLKKLAGETALYGLPSIVGRLLNYFLVPLYVVIFSPAEYGVSSLFYAYASMGGIIFSYGMETAFFRFYQKEEHKERVFSTAFISLLTTSAALIVAFFLLAKPLSTWTNNANRAIYFYYLAIILAADAVSSIVFALLRQQGKAKKFAFLKMLNICTGIILNLFFYVLCPFLLKKDIAFASYFYHQENGIEYIFIANMCSSLVVFPFLFKEIQLAKFGFDKRLWKEMFLYAFPLIFMGFAGMINETLDRVLLKSMIPDVKLAEQQIGIYSGVYKLAILITLFIQAFRFAAEPFFFSRMKDQDAKLIYAKVMDYFVIVCTTIFLVVVFYLDILKYFIPNKAYWDGLKIVPVLLMANVFLGIYYNLSIWYKLSNRTKLGALVAIIGALITLIFNYLWIPSMGYVGSAWATFICYFSMCLVSYLLGQKYYPVPYNLQRIVLFIMGALAFYAASDFLEEHFLYGFSAKITVNTILLAVYLSGIYWLMKNDEKLL